MTTRTLTANFDGLSLTLKEQPAEISTGTWLFYRMVKAKNRGRKYYDTAQGEPNYSALLKNIGKNLNVNDYLLMGLSECHILVPIHSNSAPQTSKA